MHKYEFVTLDLHFNFLVFGFFNLPAENTHSEHGLNPFSELRSFHNRKVATSFEYVEENG